MPKENKQTKKRMSFSLGYFPLHFLKYGLTELIIHVDVALTGTVWHLSLLFSPHLNNSGHAAPLLQV